MEKRIVMSKKDYTELIKTTAVAESFVALRGTMQHMMDNDEFNIEVLAITIMGITDHVVDEANELIKKYELNGVDKDSIFVVDSIAGGAE